MTNQECVSKINEAWGQRVAWVSDTEPFEIRSRLVNGTLDGSTMVPAFKTLTDIRGYRAT